MKAILALVLAIAAVLPSIRFMNVPYLHDDIQVIENNSVLRGVTRFPDAFRFQLKPSKPVTNFFLAVGHWLTPAPKGQRALSLFFHIGTVLMGFFLLVSLAEAGGGSFKIPFWTCFLYALSPVHNETLMVGLFRMEAMAAFFTLAVAGALLWIRDRVVSRVIAFLCIGLAVFSKETFLPIAVATAFIATPSGERRWVVAPAMVWSVLLVILVSTDGKSAFPYADVIGYPVSLTNSIVFAASALVEGILKTFGAMDLSSIPIPQRQSFLPSSLFAVGVLSAFALVLFSWWKREGWFRLASFLVAPVAIYLVIPNANIGSEHYWYFPAWGLCLFLVAGIFWVTEKKPKVAATVPYVLLLLALTMGNRLWETSYRRQNRLAWNTYEVLKHPESFIPWNNIAVAMLESNYPDRLERAGYFLNKAITLKPVHPMVQLTEYFYLREKGDVLGAKERFAQFQNLMKQDPKRYARYERYFNLSP